MKLPSEQQVSGQLKIIRNVTKPQALEGKSYVLMTMQLETVLSEANLSPYVELSFGGGPALQGEYRFANPILRYDGKPIFPFDGIYVSAGWVPSDQWNSAREAMAAQILPKFVEWVRLVVALPSNATCLQECPTFDATYHATQMHVVYRPQIDVLVASGSRMRRQ